MLCLHNCGGNLHDAVFKAPKPKKTIALPLVTKTLDTSTSYKITVHF